MAARYGRWEDIICLDHSYLKNIVRAPWADKISHDCIQLCSNTSINSTIIVRRLRWLGYMGYILHLPQQLIYISLFAKSKYRWRLGLIQERFWRTSDIWEKKWFLLLSTSDRAAWKHLTFVASGTSLISNGESC